MALLINSVSCTTSAATAIATHQIHVYICHGPAGEAAVQKDWTIGSVTVSAG
jgi:hypothetical protein